MTVVFYVSGHGFGHASRDIEVINTLAALRPDWRIVIRSAVPAWFFGASLRVPAELQAIEADTGVAQIDSLRLDEAETARRAARFYTDLVRRTEAEAAVLRRMAASIVVGDIPPLAFAAADRAAVPSIAMGNFTWDWIYSGYPVFDELAPTVIPVIRDAYSRATRTLRLPLHGGFESMSGTTLTDIPLIARRSGRSREDTRGALNLSPGETVVLASFGGYGLGLAYDEVARTSPFTIVVTEHEAPEPNGNPRRPVRLTRQRLADLGLRYEDLVAAADVVISKPGYGIVSECIANGPALLYTSRGRFREHDLFVAEMPRVLRCRYISQEDLLAGRWAPEVDALLEQPPPTDRLETHGAEVAAAEIITASERVQSAL
jgi:L-arabinokinase